MLLLQINDDLILASHEGVIVEIGGVLYNLVPALCSVKHDNPEGRDLLCLTVSNNARQTCCLCYADSKTCADLSLSPAELKHNHTFERVRAEVKAIVASSELLFTTSRPNFDAERVIASVSAWHHLLVSPCVIC